VALLVGDPDVSCSHAIAAGHGGPRTREAMKDIPGHSVILAVVPECDYDDCHRSAAKEWTFLVKAGGRPMRSRAYLCLDHFTEVAIPSIDAGNPPQTWTDQTSAADIPPAAHPRR
jgi:hypothetical protein